MEFSAGLQTQQEERYVILLFLLLLGGSFTTVKNRPCVLIWACALNRKNTVSYVGVGSARLSSPFIRIYPRLSEES